MATTGARQLALQVLERVRRDDAYANLALSAALDGARISGEDRALATELVYGVLRHRRLLDHVIGRHSSRPIARVNADLLDILRMAVYQLLMLDRVPAHAAVDQAVGAARALRGARVAGFVNAVLRRIGPSELSAPLPGEPAARLALECSLPDDLAARWVAQLGAQQAAGLAYALLERAPLVARCNVSKTDREALERALVAEGAEIERGRLSPLALRIARLATPFRSASYLQGLWTAQDEAAQLVALALAPGPGQTIVDLCAGVGGKTTQLAAMLAGQGRLVAVDSSERKLELLGEHCRRLGLSCERRQGDGRDPGLLADLAPDCVLVDAPCSGLGVLRRHPELKWRWDAAKLPALVELQRDLLRAALSALRPGGLLVYSVCTVTAEEGPEQLAWLRREVPTVEPLAFDSGPLATLARGEAQTTIWPHQHGTDGFFIARLRKRPSGAAGEAPPHGE